MIVAYEMPLDRPVADLDLFAPCGCVPRLPECAVHHQMSPENRGDKYERIGNEVLSQKNISEAPRSREGSLCERVLSESDHVPATVRSSLMLT